jgi:hypothetical protein
MLSRLFFALAALTMVSLGHAAKADTIYTLNYDSCSGGCGTTGQGSSSNNFGYVTLHQVNSSTVSVTVTLASGVGLDTDFVNTGNGSNHEPFAFNVDKSITVTNISNPYFTVGPSPDAISGLGTFSNTIACTSSCPSGASGANLLGNSLIFTTADGSALNISDFIANSEGYFFAADVIGPSGNTGEVASTGVTTTGNNVPEPTSIALLGSSLMALGAARILRRPFSFFRS